MSRRPTLASLIGISSAIGFLSLLAPIALGQDDAWSEALLVDEGRYLGSAGCLQCHGQPTGQHVRGDRPTIDWCLMTEFSTWRAVDKHSMAYAVLEGPRGQKIGELMGIEHVEQEARCLSCHALDIPEERTGIDYSTADGVNCEACHGPANGIGDNQGWATAHFSDRTWRDKTPDEKAEFGYIELRAPEAKVTLCLSCHIGDAGLGRVVTHPMYAAGHPPLPSIDVAAFVKNLPQHWRDQDQIPYWDEAPERVREALGIEEDKLYETEVSLASGVLSLRETMELLSARADLSGVGEETIRAWPELTLHPEFGGDLPFDDPDRLRRLARSRWPEMAMTHLDCAGCHHDLRLPGWRPARGFRVTPGRPLPRSWTNPVIELTLDLYGTEEDDEAYRRHLDELTRAFGDQVFGDPKQVSEAAESLRSWSNEFYQAKVGPAPVRESDAMRIMATLCNVALGELPDYDTARQIAATLRVTYREWTSRDGTPEPDAATVELLDALEEGLNLGRYPYSEERDALSLEVLETLAGRSLSGFKDWTPRALGYAATPEEYYEVAEGNEVLQAIRNIFAPDLRDAYVTGDFKARLQAINNRGLGRALEIAGRYDPYAFQQTIRALQQRLPEP